MARKVVGVGSVGTRAFIVLLQGRDQQGPTVPAGQGGDALGARGPSAEEPLQAARRARRAGAADDAGRERHLPGLDEGRGRKPLLLLAPAPRHEGLGRRRIADAFRPRVLRSPVRMDARARARPIGRPDRDRCVPGQGRRGSTSPITDFSERYADQNERDYQGLHRGDPLRTTESDRRRLDASKILAESRAWRARARRRDRAPT